MFAFLDNMIVDIYALQNVYIVANTDDVTYDIVAYNLPEGQQILKNFAKEADAKAFLKKIQDEIAKLEGTPVIDLRS